MTVTVSEAVDLADIASLDFDTPVLCDVNECHDDRLAAQPAVALLIKQLVCCTESAPACQRHVVDAERCKAEHRGILCFKHRIGQCSHAVLRIEPLP